MCHAGQPRYVWIGTYKGLNRYDGTRIKNYGRQDLGVKSDYINVLAEDSAGNILIGTDNGIVIYDYRKDSFRQPLQAELLDDRIYSIQNDSKGISWIGSRAQGLFSYDPETDAVSKIDLKNPEGKLVRDIYRIVIDRNDKMHVAVYCDNLYRLTGDFTMERLATSGKAGYFEKDDIEGLVLNQQPDVHSKQATWPLPAGPEDGGSQRPGNIARRFQAGISVGKRRHLVAGDIIRRGEILGGKRHLFDIEARQCRQIFVVRRLYHDGQSRQQTEACSSERPRKVLIITAPARIYSRNSTRPPTANRLKAVLSAASPRTGTASYGSHLKGTG